MSVLSRPLALWALVAALTSVSVAAFLHIYRDMQSNLKDGQSLVLGYELPRLADCIAALPAETVSGPSEATTLCYDRLYSQGLLNDFQTRRAKFAIQQSSDLVILWMVVSLTLSGVLLAGLQLGAAYRLARSGQAFAAEGEFALEQGKVVFRSSVTGLFILLFSFAFFYVYILEVYTIHEIDPDRRERAESHAGQYTERFGVERAIPVSDGSEPQRYSTPGRYEAERRPGS